MDVIFAIVLGAVQGITEFLPVSSSAHLIIVSFLQNGEVLSITMNVAFHMGTLAAVLWYFRVDWFRLIQGLLSYTKRQESEKFSTERHLLNLLFVGSIPAGLIGIIWKDDIEAIFHKPEMTIIPLAAVGILMWIVDIACRSHRSIDKLSYFHALVIGVFQACALIPGTSRSGSTIMGGRVFGLNRVEAARFSFLLGTPAMLGAALLELRHLAAIDFSLAFICGIVSSAVVGAFSIKFLLAFLSRFGFAFFAIYRCLLAGALFHFFNS